MSRHRLSFTDRRRVRLARTFERLETMENRTLVTEPINLFALSLGGSLGMGLALVGAAQAGADRNGETALAADERLRSRARSRKTDPAPLQAQALPTHNLSIAIVPDPYQAGGGTGGAAPDVSAGSSSTATQPPAVGDDWLSLSPGASSDAAPHGASALAPARRPASQSGCDRASAKKNGEISSLSWKKCSEFVTFSNSSINNIVKY
jgi:hypothetical protein